MRWLLALHPLEPLLPLLRRLERLGVVAGLSEDLSVAQLEDEHEVDFPPTTVVDDPLHNPQPLPYPHAAQPGRSRSRVSLLELSHLLAAPETLARLRPLHHVVLVAYLVFRFGTKEGKQLVEEMVGLLLLHLLEVGHPLRVHLRSSFRSNEVLYLPTAMVPSSEAQHIRRSLIHRSAWNKNSRKFVSKILHNATPIPLESPAPDTLHSPGQVPLATPMDRYARLWMHSCGKHLFAAGL